MLAKVSALRLTHLYEASVESIFHVGGLHKHILMSRSCHAEGWAVEVAVQASAIERSPKAPWPRQALDPFSSRVAGLAARGWPGKGPLRHHPLRDSSVCCAFSPNPALISRVQYKYPMSYALMWTLGVPPHLMAWFGKAFGTRKFATRKPIGIFCWRWGATSWRW